MAAASGPHQQYQRPIRKSNMTINSEISSASPVSGFVFKSRRSDAMAVAKLFTRGIRFTGKSSPVQQMSNAVTILNRPVRGCLLGGEPVFIAGDVQAAMGRTSPYISSRTRDQMVHGRDFVYILQGSRKTLSLAFTLDGIRTFAEIGQKNRNPRWANQAAALLKATPNRKDAIEALAWTDLGHALSAYAEVLPTNDGKLVEKAAKVEAQPLGTVSIDGTDFPAFRDGGRVFVLARQLFVHFGFSAKAVSAALHRTPKRVSPKEIRYVSLDRLRDGGSAAPSRAMSLEGILHFLSVSTHRNAQAIRNAITSALIETMAHPEQTIEKLPYYVPNKLNA
jgi:hypothetical protein